jgi:hypothetical protein
MPSITDILQQGDIGKIIGDLSKDTRDDRESREYLDEYNGDRTRRPDSVGNREPKKVKIYSDTLKDKNGNPVVLEEKTVPVAKVILNFPQQVVTSSVACMFGGKMTLSADDNNDGFAEFKRLWTKKLKMQSVLQQFATYLLAETKAAIIFYPSLSSDGGVTLRVKILHLPQKEENDDDYTFYPHFDDNDDLDAFIYNYIDDNGIQCSKIWTADKIIDAQNNGIWQSTTNPNRFGLIPVVYGEVDNPDWEPAVHAMDYREKRLSRMDDTNDYFADPILKSFGDSDLPSKETAGKEITFPIKVDEETGKEIHGDAEFLSWQQSIDSIDKELTELKAEMYASTHTPDLSFDNMKGIGNISGVARRFMMLDSEIKRVMNMSIFGPVVTRCVSVMRAGMSNVTDIKYASQLNNNDINVNFASILPEDLAETLANLQTANGGEPVNSQETTVGLSPYTTDPKAEMEKINQEKEARMQTASMVGQTEN